MIRPVTLDVTSNASFREHPMTKQPALGFSAVGRLRRSERGMTHLVPHIGDEVTVQIEAEFVRG